MHRAEFSDFLRNLPALSEFQPHELEVLEQAMIVDDYPDGHVFIDENRRGAGMFLLVRGEVTASHRRSRLRGVDIIERLQPGDLFGLLALVDHRPPWATYRAAGPVTVAFLPSNAFELLFTADAPIAHHFQHLTALQLVRDYRACIRSLTAAFEGGGA